MLNSRGTHALPVPNSARVLLWYGWRDDPENEDKKWLKIGLSNRLFNVEKCY